MADITIFELHFDGGLQLGPSFGDDPSPDTEATDGGDPTTADDGGNADDETETPAIDVDVEESGAPVKSAILGVLALVALAVAARVLLGDDDDVDDVEIVDLDADAHERTDADQHD
jgi:hypothetical protein